MQESTIQRIQFVENFQTLILQKECQLINSSIEKWFPIDTMDPY